MAIGTPTPIQIFIHIQQEAIVGEQVLHRLLQTEIVGILGNRIFINL